ncbi:MAG: hypothetical protein HY825_18385 [Acidobacteria bacterium]|nr:hypothetical protein [Acidobacteriota bacterium]
MLVVLGLIVLASAWASWAVKHRATEILSAYRVDDYEKTEVTLDDAQKQLLFQEIQRRFPQDPASLVLANLNHHNLINASAVSARTYMFLGKHVLDYNFRHLPIEQSLVLVLMKTRPASAECQAKAARSRAQWLESGKISDQECLELLACALDSVGTATRLGRR